MQANLVNLPMNCSIKIVYIHKIPCVKVNITVKTEAPFSVENTSIAMSLSTSREF